MEIRFKLYPKNEKDKMIIDVLSGEYSPSKTIKNILYKMGMNGAESQRVSFGGLNDDIKVSHRTDNKPIDGDEVNREEEVLDGSKWKVMDDEIVADNDIICYFCN